MQKWSPEPFAAPATEQPFIPVGKEWSDDPLASRLRDYRPAYGFDGSNSLLGHLTGDEREQLYQLVETDVEAAYREKYQKHAKEQEAQSAHFLADMAQQLQTENQQNVGILARETATLALSIAEKIIRHEVTLDVTVLQRTLETVLYKLDSSATLEVVVNPEDASRLKTDPELLEKLRISKVVTDRRVEAGGCLARTERQEWDVTLSKQLATITEIIQQNLEGDLTEMERDDDIDTPVA
ncbi:MAG: FliH/SctL family protein [bacterium]